VSDAAGGGGGGGRGGGRAGRDGGAPTSAPPLYAAGDGGAIADLAWDPSARRLAVALRAPHRAAGCVALYATRAAAPVSVSAQLIGFLRPFAPPGGGGGGRAGAGLRVAFAPRPLMPSSCGGGGGGGDGRAAGGSSAAAAAAPSAILSVRDLEGEGRGGGRVANVALHF
jgi:hypothetical protein